MILTVNIPRYRGRQSALYIGVIIVIAIVVIISAILLSNPVFHPPASSAGQNNTSTASPARTSTLKVGQSYTMAINNFDSKPNVPEITA
jgi:hypothetical protein